MQPKNTLDTFRLKGEDDYKNNRFDVKSFSRLVKKKKRHTGKLHYPSFPPETLAWFLLLREVKHLTTCFRQNDIFTKTRCKMTTFIMFSRQNEAGSRASALLSIDLVTVFDAILTSRQTREKLQCLYENLMSNNFRRTAVLTKI